MTCTIEKVLADARLLVNRLKEHDTAADNVITDAQNLHKRVDAMKQYQEDIDDLNEMARHKPRSSLIVGIVQENNQIRELQQQNKDLYVSLEEHQSALELIMSKYRQQMMRLIMVNKMQDGNSVDDMPKDTLDKINTICDMVTVMRKAAACDDDTANREKELLTQLQVENKGLRELLKISTHIPPEVLTSDKDIQTEVSSEDEDSDRTVLEKKS